MSTVIMCFLQHDLAPLEQRVKQLSQQAKRLSSTYPEAAKLLRKREEEAVVAWRELTDRSQKRKEKLGQAEELQRFLNDFRDQRYEQHCTISTAMLCIRSHVTHARLGTSFIHTNTCTCDFNSCNLYTVILYMHAQ